MIKKPRVGIYAITGCYGCLLSVIYNETELLDMVELIDLRSFPFIKEVNDESKLDIVILEGTVVYEGDLELLKNLRKRTKILVALGACACNGGAPSLRNFIDPQIYKHLVYHKASHLHDLDPKPIDAFVKVEYYIPGCPPDKEEIKNFLKDIILDKIPRLYIDPVCVECRRNENRCLLEDNKICLGPITRGGCNSVCTNGGLECWGCRGPTDDANFEELLSLLEEKGVDLKHIRERMETFVGLRIAEINKGKKWLEK